MSYSPLELAAAFIQTGELNDALEALDAHLAQQPQDDRARRMRIGVCKHLGDGHLNTALTDFAQIHTPKAEDYIQHSTLLEQVGRADDALYVLAAAHSRWPEHERLTERYLHLLLAHGKTDTALTVVRGQPHVWRWLQWEGDTLAAQGDDTLATARYGLALAQLEDQVTDSNARYFAPIQARLLLARAGAYRRLGMFDQADEHYTDAGKLIPDDPAIPFNQGLLAWQRGDSERALSLCQKALEAASRSLRAHLLAELDAEPDLNTLRVALAKERS
jgi:tetratricopeptide (TPR) repeat protein